MHNLQTQDLAAEFPWFIAHARASNHVDKLRYQIPVLQMMTRKLPITLPPSPTGPLNMTNLGASVFIERTRNGDCY